MKGRKRKIQTYSALRNMILWPTLVLLMLGLTILTCCVAADMVHQLEGGLRMYVDHLGSRENNDDAGIPGTPERNMIEELGFPYYTLSVDPLLPFVGQQRLTNGVGSRDWLWGKWELYYGYEAAVCYSDAEGNPLIYTRDYLSFDYTTAEDWAGQNPTVQGKGYIALDTVPGGKELCDRMISDLPTGDWAANLIFPLIRLTGWFEGNRFHPAQIDYAWYADPFGSVREPVQFSILDARGKVEWEPLLSVDPVEGQELVTIYAWDCTGYNSNSKKVTVKGEAFDSLSGLLLTAMDAALPFDYEKQNLMETVIIEYTTHKDSYGEYRIAAAVRCRPLVYAAVRLVWVYLISFCLTGFLLRRWLKRVQNNLTIPMGTMVSAAYVGHNITPRSGWSEPRALEEDFVASRQTIAQQRTELTQLRTALDYARDAEEKRKTLISNITHELKTPLAIIRSYTECLQEKVNPEKEQDYLSTIQEETERMDGMVLQMLELSRLEAGKVKLSSEPFSLLALIKEIADRLEPIRKERNLELHYDLAQEFTMNGDEGRMGQVVTNLMTNALKYSTEGGQIRVKLYLSPGYVHFSLENTAAHLAQEDLDRVFDSFYRGDASRNTPGTGLGLALVKSIISLHGGECTVRNTVMEDNREGVEFGFRIPLK
ncbi:MAG: HAMP domain-containing histidine kinase [Oscillospiraceae bacterium]|nr:HAMP domain-containing histidine kinase [Oscillospiraceae bacterium]MBR2890707.1 HAMP domain-containing histidine kinase [Oscillospiraceae bacterium]